MSAHGHGFVPSSGTSHESVQQRLNREESERQSYLSHLTDAEIDAQSQAAAQRRKTLLQQRVEQARKLEGPKRAAAVTTRIATRGIEYAYASALPPLRSTCLIAFFRFLCLRTVPRAYLQAPRHQ